MSDIWTERYRPRTPDKMIRGEDLVTRIRSFLKGALTEIKRVAQENEKIRSYNASVPKSKRKKEIQNNGKKVALLLRGPPGIGKTTAVWAVANLLKMPVTESNASDYRTKDKIKELIEPAAKYTDITSFMRSESSDKVILFDEVDGMSGNADRGGVQTLIRLIRTTSYPIILTANEWKRNLRGLYEVCQEYDVPRPSVSAITENLARIAREEALEVSKTALHKIAVASGGDYRAAINDLQVLLTSKRDQLDTFIEAVNKYFAAESVEEAETSFRTYSTDATFFFYRYIFENMLPRIERGKEGEACRAMALADLVEGYIKTTEDWSMFPQFAEIFRSAAVYMTTSRDRFVKPKWYATNEAKLEELMSTLLISRKEAETLARLLEAKTSRGR